MIDMGILDGAACALLAAAAAVRARVFGAHVTGALVLGCLCGLIGPLLREAFVHGAMGTARIARELPAEALAGAVCGLAALFMLRRMESLRGRLFGWLDSAGIGMGSSVGAILALPELGVAGALAIGLINGLAPGLIRDMALGDTAMLVEKSWYATAAALGCAASIAMFTGLYAVHMNSWTVAHPESVATCAGFLTVVAIRSWKMRNGEDI